MTNRIERLPIKLAENGSVTTRVNAQHGATISQSHGAPLLPVYGSEFANGFDLVTPCDFEVTEGLHVTIDLGWATALPDGYGMLVMPRSGLGNKGVLVTNTIGLIDQDYRGNIIVNVTLRSNAIENRISFARGDRFAQAIIVPLARVQEFELVDTLPESSRGAGGFGSSGLGA